MRLKNRQRHRQATLNQRLTLDTAPATIYGASGLFDLCGDADLMSLSFEGQNPFLDWIGWNGTDVYRLHEYFIHTVRPAYDGDTPSVGYLADPCADGNGVEWGFADFMMQGFARLRRHGPVRDITAAGLRLCEAQPRYRLDGTQIMNDAEFDMRLVTEVIIQDLKRMVIDGNSATPGQFSGLERLVATGYTDTEGRLVQAMDSIVIDWNGNDLDGGTGVTWNGNAIADTWGFIDVLRNAVRQIIQRVQMAPALGMLQAGDIALVMPTHVAQCVLAAYTCWSVCPGVQYREANLNTLEARDFFNSLVRSVVPGANYTITIEGVDIPIFTYDWGLLNGDSGRADVYLLTRAVGNVRLIRGQYNDMNRVIREQGALDRGEEFGATDGGRLLVWDAGDHTCQQIYEEMQPRLVVSAPWAQVRFIDVNCDQPGPFLSADPTSSWHINSSFFIAGS